MKLQAGDREINKIKWIRIKPVPRAEVQPHVGEFVHVPHGVITESGDTQYILVLVYIRPNVPR
jgi:hypothetical protein